MILDRTWGTKDADRSQPGRVNGNGGANGITMKIKSDCTGTWRITQMSNWDIDFINLVAPGHVTVRANGIGKLAFGAIQAEIDCRIEKVGALERLGFSFAGWDEGDEICGRGWAVVAGDKMKGWLCFHLGDDSTFKAEKQRRAQ